MAIAYKSAGSGAGTETSGATLNVPCPASVDANDILIAHIIITGTSTSPSTPSGWELLYGPANVGTTATARHWCYGKLAAGTEDGSNVDFGNPSVTDGRAGRIYSFSGYSSGTITDVVPSASFSSTPHATDPQGPSVTTTIAGALAVALLCQDDNNTWAAISGMSGGTWSEPVGEYSNATWGPQGIVIGINTCTPTSDPGTVSGGAVSATNDESGTIGFEIRPNIPPQSLTGSAASATWSVVAQAIIAGAVALSGAAATAAWAIPTQSLQHPAVEQALSGSAATAAWAIPAQGLSPGAVSLSGAAPSAAWTIPTQTLDAGAVALSGSASIATWAIPTQSLVAGSVDLSGTSPVATWALPSHSLSPGVVALDGSAPSAAWTITAQTLDAGQVAIAGSSATASWAIPSQSLTPGVVALSGAEAVSTWAVPEAALIPPPVALSGNAATASWTVPSQALDISPLALSGVAPSAAWTIPTQSLAPGDVTISGAPAEAVWGFPTHELTHGGAMSGLPAVSTWVIPDTGLTVTVYLWRRTA